MAQTTQVALKVIFVVHLVLSVWATIEFMGPAYIYMNAFALAFAVWAIICPDSIDAAFMYFVMNTISIVMDIILISIFGSLGSQMIQTSKYKFSLGMAILNLIIKPVSCFILYRLYQDRAGELHFPQFPAYGDDNQRRGYETIDQPVYPSQVETAAPHTQVGKRPLE